MTKRVPKLDLLNTVVGRAVAELNRPPTEEEGSKAIYPLPAYLDGKGRKVVWQMVSKLHEQAPETYDRFLGDHFLADLIVDVVAERDALTTWPDLISALDQYAEQERDWLVAVPLANLMPPRGYVPLSETAGLGMAAQGRDRDGIGEPPMNSLDVFRHLRDRLGAGLRWRSEDSRLGPLDTRRTAALLLVGVVGQFESSKPVG